MTPIYLFDKEKRLFIKIEKSPTGLFTRYSSHNGFSWLLACSTMTSLDVKEYSNRLHAQFRKRGREIAQGAEFFVKKVA